MKYLLILLIGTAQAHTPKSCQDYQLEHKLMLFSKLMDACEKSQKIANPFSRPEKTVSETVTSFLDLCIKRRNPSPSVCVKQAIKLKRGLER